MASKFEFDFKHKFAAVLAGSPVPDSDPEQVAAWQIVLSNINDVGFGCGFFDSILDFLEYIEGLKKNVLVYFHDLKYAGQFIISELVNFLDYKPALFDVDKWEPPSKMKRKSFSMVVADNGEWYIITIKLQGGKMLVLSDSSKLLPFKYDEIFHDFKLKEDLKLDKISICENHKFGAPASEAELDELWKKANIIKCGLREFDKRRELKITIGQCCMSNFKKLCSNRRKIEKKKFSELFPNLYEIKTPEGFPQGSAGEFIARAYQSGWCYLNPEYKGRILKFGASADCNSLYPYVMSSKSGRRYPTGKPLFWKGRDIPDDAKKGIFYIHIKAAFKLKAGHFPCIRTNSDILQNRYKWLEDSSVFYNGKYYNYFFDSDGTKHRVLVDLYLSNVDLLLFFQHYEIHKLYICEGLYFPPKQCEIGLFDDYIFPYYKAKRESEGAPRQIAKLFLVNLSGKFAASRRINFRIPYIHDDGTVTMELSSESEERKNAGYIAIGALITAYGREEILRIAHLNKANFIYADTDSIHGFQEGHFKGLKFGNDIGEWKFENIWARGWFYRQKCYILDDKKSGMKVTCAGMEDRLKEDLKIAIQQTATQEDWQRWDSAQRRFYRTKPDIDCLQKGLQLTGAKVLETVKGGAVYKKEKFEILY